MNLLDDTRPERRREALDLLEVLESDAPAPGARRIGVTGAPGAGKSTLLDAIVRNLRDQGRTVGIVAIDPSSRRTGGALLGDRVRVRAGAADPGVFFRSMASRERLGGLADATHASVTVLGVVFDYVFIETVGVGQSEADVEMVCDSLLFAAQPGAGDTLQFMKAGLMEIPDVFAVNKSDLGPPAERTRNELENALGMSERDAGWTPPVLAVSARDGTGIAELMATLDAHRQHLLDTDTLDARRRRGASAAVLDALERRYGGFGLDGIGGRAAAAERLNAAPEGAFNLLRKLSAEIEDRLRKG